jgi:DNA helicase-2/ATP-dependent DNA helicase PcrA
MARHYSLKKRPASPLAAFRIPYATALNERQLAAASAPGGATLVIAGAGSGKTRALTYRVAYLLESGIAPDRILLLTFTNKAAREMVARVEALLPAEARSIWAGTFHHVGHRLLRRYAPVLGRKSDFSILDREDSRKLLDACVPDLGIDVKARRFPKGDVLQDLISHAIDTESDLVEVTLRRAPQFSPLAAEIVKVADRYQERKRTLNALDFDDLVNLWYVLMKNHEGPSAEIASRFEHVLVDEYQDTNRLQADVVDLVAKRHGNLTVVGDDFQSIYSFRGARVENILEFEKRWPGARVLKLETNYRSTPEVLALANEVIRGNPRQFPKTLVASRASREKPALVALADGDEQARFVAQRLLELRDEGRRLDECAVLYRSHYQALELQLEFTRRNIPYAIRSGVRFFEQAHVKDVLAHLRIVHNPADELAWRRVLPLLPRIGDATASKLFSALCAARGATPLEAAIAGRADPLVPKAAREAWRAFTSFLGSALRRGLASKPAEFVRAVVAEGGYEDVLFSKFPNASIRLEDLDALSRHALRFESVEALLAEVALEGTPSGETVVEGAAADEEKVVLTTIHQAKGLEWAAVFVIGLVDGRMPSARALREAGGEEEERRLFYVAVTRAKDELYLTWPRMQAAASGFPLIVRASRFISEISKDVAEEWDVSPETGLLFGAAPDEQRLARDPSLFIESRDDDNPGTSDE